MSVWKVYLLCRNRELLSEADRLGRNADNASWEQGKELAQIVRDTGADTCQSKARVVKRVCELLRPHGLLGKVVLETQSPEALGCEVCTIDG